MPKEGGLIMADNLGSSIPCSRACDKAACIGSDPWLKQSSYGWDTREKIEGPRSHCPSKICPQCPKRPSSSVPSSFGILKCFCWQMLIINSRFYYGTFIHVPFSSLVLLPLNPFSLSFIRVA